MRRRSAGSTGYRAMRRGDWLTSWLLLAGIAGAVALTAAIVVGSLETPHYDNVGDAISQLAARGRPHPAVVEWGMAVFGLLTVAFACGLRRRLQQGLWSIGASASFALLGLAAFGCALFREPIETSPVDDWEHTAHMVSGRVAAGALILGAFAVSRAVAGRSGWRWVSVGSVALAGVGLFAAIAFTLSLEVSLTGLLQKGFLGLFLLWIVWVVERAMRAAAARTRAAPVGAHRFADRISPPGALGCRSPAPRRRGDDGASSPPTTPRGTSRPRG